MISFCVRRPVTVIMFCLGLLVLGFISATKIPIQLLPEFITPEFKIITQVKSATSLEIEDEVTTPLERSLSTLDGLEKMTSESKMGQSVISLVFKNNIDYYETLSMMREKIESTTLPDYAARPKIARYQSNAGPVMTFVMAPNAKESLSEFAQKIDDIFVKKIEKVEGVAIATVSGAPELILNITIDPIKSYAFTITPQLISEIIKSKNNISTAGSLTINGKNMAIRVGDKIEKVNDIKSLVIKNENGKIIRLEDVASVEIVEQKRNSKILYQGKNAIMIDIRKDSEANSVELTKKLNEFVQEFSENNPTVQYSIIQNQGKEIKESIDNVVSNVIQGGILAAVIILLFMQSWRPTFIISAAIPMSITMTLIMMYFSGVTFNLMSLAGLALGVGMLMDNSVVVLENIGLLRRKIDDGQMAAIVGTQKVFSAILASTLTSSVVFLPLCFIGGTIGNLFKDISLTVVYSLISSLIVAITLVPMLSSRSIAESKNDKRNSDHGEELFQYLESVKTLENKYSKTLVGKIITRLLRYIFSNFFAIKFMTKLMIQAISTMLSLSLKIIGKYTRKIDTLLSLKVFTKVNVLVVFVEKYFSNKIDFVLKNKNKYIEVSLLLMVVSIAIFAFKGSDLMGQDGESRVTYQLAFEQGTTIEKNESVTKLLCEKIKLFDGVQDITAKVGLDEEHLSLLEISHELDDKKFAQLEQFLKKVFSSYSGISYSKINKGLMNTGPAIEIEVYDDDLKELYKRGPELIEEIKKIDGLKNVTSNNPNFAPIISVQFSKEKLEQFQMSSGDYTQSIKNTLVGVTPGLISLEGKDYPLLIKIDDRNLKTLDNVTNYLSPDKTKSIYLSTVSEVSPQKIPTLISHLEKKRSISIYADLNGIDQSKATQLIKKILDKRIKSFGNTGIKWKMGGQEEERVKSQMKLIVTVALALFLIYLLLASQFESFLQPIIILIAVPLCIIGIAFMLFVFNLNLSAMVFVGLIILVGISVNTSIVMVDTINQYLVEGMDWFDAVIRGSIDRIRPILMTTIANILGLLPMIFATGQGESMRKALAFTIMGGLFSSTFLTLILIPIVYSKILKWNQKKQAKAEINA